MGCLFNSNNFATSAPFDGVRALLCAILVYLFRPQCSSPRTGEPINSRLTVYCDNMARTPEKK